MKSSLKRDLAEAHGQLDFPMSGMEKYFADTAKLSKEIAKRVFVVEGAQLEKKEMNSAGIQLTNASLDALARATAMLKHQQILWTQFALLAASICMIKCKHSSACMVEPVTLFLDIFIACGMLMCKCVCVCASKQISCDSWSAVRDSEFPRQWWGSFPQQAPWYVWDYFEPIWRLSWQ